MLHALVGLLAYFGLGIVFVRVALARVGAADEPEIGSHAWHVAAFAAALASVLVVVLVAWLLYRAPSFGPPDRHAGRVGRVFAVGLLAALIVTAVCTVQLNMATVVWQWFHPGEVPPFPATWRTLQHPFQGLNRGEVNHGQSTPSQRPMVAYMPSSQRVTTTMMPVSAAMPSLTVQCCRETQLLQRR